MLRLFGEKSLAGSEPLLAYHLRNTIPEPTNQTKVSLAESHSKGDFGLRMLQIAQSFFEILLFL